MNKRWTMEDVEKLGLKTDLKKTADKSATQLKPSALENYQALGRMKSGAMNKTEQRYADHLELLKTSGAILKYWFEAMNLRLADNCFYRIDFLVLQSTGHLEVHEVKGGYITDDSLVKIKVAAETFPFRFVAIQWKNKEWITREF